MRVPFYLVATAIAMLGLAGCNQAHAPADVQADVTSAANTAAEKNALANEKQADVAASVNKDVSAATQAADIKTEDASADAALTRAEGNHKVSLAKCEALAGDAQKACRDEADAALEMAKARAKVIKAKGN
jgi:hypothetical protein